MNLNELINHPVWRVFPSAFNIVLMALAIAIIWTVSPVEASDTKLNAMYFAFILLVLALRWWEEDRNAARKPE